jgi:hypothetical protein
LRLRPRQTATMSDQPIFTAAILAEAFHELGRIATRDVDAVAAADQGFLDQAAATVAARRGWPRDWLNDGVRTYLSPLVEGFEQHALFRTYPSEDKPGLRVFAPTPEYLLAMKLMALRLDPASERNDLDDILNLMQVVGLQNKAEIVQFAARFYLEARVSGKLALLIDYLWNEYASRRSQSNRHAPRYLGRGGAAG